MIVVTGATGRTGRAATEALLAKGEKVRLVGRDAKKMTPFVELGAEPFVGNVEDVASMTEAFNGASAVYLVLPEARNRICARIKNAFPTPTPQQSPTPMCGLSLI
jgi:uncharacterized protein YbjT (DUF2867 family)